MKKLSRILFTGIILFLNSCGNGKGSDPAPTKPTPPVVVVTPPPVIDNTPDYQVSLARTNQTVLDSTHSNIIQIGFEIAGKNALKYSVDGNVSIRTKNFDQQDVIYENGTNDERLYFSNSVQKSEAATIAAKDTTTKACWIITDPKAIDQAGKQVVQILFLYNDLTVGAGADHFTSNTKFITNEISATQASVINKRNDLKQL